VILATRIWFKVILTAFILASCNPVKKALRKKAEIDAAIAQWVLDNPLPIDSVYIRGDEVIVYRDTTIKETVYDTLRQEEIIRLTKFIDRHITRTDTIVKTVVNDVLVRDMLNVNNKMQGQIDSLEKDRKGLIQALTILGGLFLILLIVMAYNLFK
jgi:hypothetical protein